MEVIAKICERCCNEDPKYFALQGTKKYCRKCLQFDGLYAEAPQVVKGYNYCLPYSLTLRQAKCSEVILNSIKNYKSILVHAVCGAGKTEITYESISYILSQNKCVGFAIPRKDVVIELAVRLQNHFPQAKVIAVYGSHTKELTGDIIICTTHQLYRYKKCFGLLIIDEVDAFPYNGDEILHNFAAASANMFIYLSATPPQDLLELANAKKINVVSLTRRHHGYLLPVPKIIKIPHVMMFGAAIVIAKKMLRARKKVFIYAPTIKQAEFYHRIIKKFISNTAVVHSKVEKRKELIEKFRQKQIKVLVTTSILERGITMERLQVIVLNANHSLFNKDVLVQIAGRVGRKSNDPIGEVIFLGFPSQSMKDAVKQIIKSNETLPDLF